MISLFLDTFYIVRILDYQAPVMRGYGGQKGGRGEKGEGGEKRGREKWEDEGREKGGEGERGREKGEKGEMGERDPLYPLIYDDPCGASRLQF